MKTHLRGAYCGVWCVAGVMKRDRLLFVCLHILTGRILLFVLAQVNGSWEILLHCHYFILKHSMSSCWALSTVGNVKAHDQRAMC